MSVDPGVVAAYVHNAASPELGKIGVLVALKSTADKAKLAALGKQLAMHIAAAAPLALTPEHLPPDVVERERDDPGRIGAPVRQAGKRHREDDRRPDAQVLRRDGAALADLRHRRRNARSRKVIEKAAKDLGAPIEIAGFVRFQVGEGIEKADSDFADEVNRWRAR